MAGFGKNFDSLRLNRFENERLIFALLISLALHMVGFGGYELNKYFGWSQRLHWWHRAEKIKPELLQPPLQNSEPTLFVDVNPEQATAEAPPDAKYYSSKNSRAANPEAERDTDTPKLNGKQTDVPMTEDALHPQFSKSTVDANKQEANDQQENKEQKPVLSAGDLTLGNPNDSLQQHRPRTLNQARAMMANRAPGVQMQQDGGTQRRAMVPSFDAKATAFGAYDAAFFDAMQQCWNDELDRINYSGYQAGKVVIEFQLNYDGRITDIKVVETTVGETMTLMCKLAILNPAPYAPWPSDMRRENGKDSRDILITFYYY